MKTVFVAAVLSAVIASTAPDKLTGRWETKPSVNGNVTGVVFKPDNSFEGYINQKPFTSGTYTLDGDTLAFTDNGCQGMRGVYKIVFFSSSDSLRFKAITDSCTERQKGMERLVMGRVKQ